MNSEESLENKKETIMKEEFRPTSLIQDFVRLLILLIHFYYFTFIIDTWGVSPEIFLFLTTITFFINTSYFTLTLGNSILHKFNNSVIVLQCKIHTIFRLGFTMSNVVIILYWGIYWHDPNMLGEKELPFHFDLFLHGGNLVVLIIDRVMVDQEHRYEKRLNSKVLLVIAVAYFAVIYSVFLLTGFAVYPLIAKLGFTQLLVLLSAAYGLFLIGNQIYKLII